MKRLEGSDGAGLLGVLVVLVLWIPAAAWTGYVLSQLWGWFIAPLGVRGIGIWHGAGIAVLVRLLTYQTDEEEDSWEFIIRNIVYSVLYPAIVLVVATVYKAWM